MNDQLRALKDDELIRLGSMLEDYHKCFYTFFELSAVWMVGDDHFVKTAGVVFPESKFLKPEMYLNETFWNGLTEREKLFVICHETLHVLLDHGVRNGLSVPGSNPRLVNIAQDITINEMICDPNVFKFDRNDIRDWKKFCWIDTCFKEPWKVKRNQTFMYYLELLIKEPPKAEQEGGPLIFDSHSSLPHDGTPEQSQPSQPQETQRQKEARESAAQKIAEDLSAREIEEVMKAMPEGDNPGTMTGVLDVLIDKKTKPLKLKFQSIIKKLKKSSVLYVDKDVETFIAVDRRFDDIIRRNSVTLPGTLEKSVRKPGRLLTAVFMDISGSMYEYFPFSQKVFAAFEKEEKIFDARMFVFDTQVTEINAKRTARGFGGTRFDIVETKCRELEQETGRYPDCVIMITDGDGNRVSPKIPNRWIWLMTPHFNAQYVHPTSKYWEIKDVVL